MIKALNGFMVLGGREGMSTSHHPKSGGHRYCDSGDIIDLVCQVILQDHVVKELCDIMGKRLSR